MTSRKLGLCPEKQPGEKQLKHSMFYNHDYLCSCDTPSSEILVWGRNSKQALSCKAQRVLVTMAAVNLYLQAITPRLKQKFQFSKITCTGFSHVTKILFNLLNGFFIKKSIPTTHSSSNANHNIFRQITLSNSFPHHILSKSS